MSQALITNADDFVVGSWTGGGQPPQSTPDRKVNRVDSATFRTYSDNPRYEGSSQFRWSYTQAGGLVENPDQRPRIRAMISGETTADGPFDHEILTGEPAQTLTLQEIDEDGNWITERTNNNARLQLADFRLAVDLVAGEAQIRVPTEKPREVTITSNEQLAFENFFTISIVATEL